MTRAERNTLALILLALAYIGLRIVATAYAQESADVPTSAGGAVLVPVPAKGRPVGGNEAPPTGRIANDDRGAWRRSAVQGAMLARIIVSERSEVLRISDYDASEIDLFASVVINNRNRYRDAHGWLDVMGHLSPHVTKRREPTRPRHEWTSTLVGCTEAKPSGWASERDGDWNNYALRWQSFCLDVRDRWVREEFTITVGVIAWGNLGDAHGHICKRSSRNLCPVASYVGVNDRTNVWFATVGDDVCSEALREAFVEEHCEGSR